MANPRPPFTPKYWPAWLLVGFIRLLGTLPHPFGLKLMRGLGPVLRGLLKSRFRIAARNIERALPEQSDAARDALLVAHSRALAAAPLEVAWAWYAGDEKIHRISELRGLEHLEAARRLGNGVLLLTGHMTCLEMGGRVVHERVPLTGVYRPLGNPVLEWFQNRSRGQHGARYISKRDLRGILRALRDNQVLWYAPDQDFGPRRSAFAPFFGIETATLTATRRLVTATRCAVVPMLPMRDENDRYVVEILPALESFPSEDERADLSRINQAIETMARQALPQYWWIHRRFKTRPSGEPPFYV